MRGSPYQMYTVKRKGKENENVYINNAIYRAPKNTCKQGCHEELNMISWNINGLQRKICDTDFVDIIQSHDIIILSQTLISKNSCYNLDIKAYRVFHLYGNKSINKTKGRYSGGIYINYKSDISDKTRNITECD